MGSIFMGIAAGAAVSLFGIWAFLKGQSTMADIRESGRPKNLAGPSAILRQKQQAKEAQKERQRQEDYARQMRALFGDGAGPASRPEE